jgi:hypothetical protein
MRPRSVGADERVEIRDRRRGGRRWGRRRGRARGPGSGARRTRSAAGLGRPARDGARTGPVLGRTADAEIDGDAGCEEQQRDEAHQEGSTTDAAALWRGATRYPRRGGFRRQRRRRRRRRRRGPGRGQCATERDAFRQRGACLRAPVGALIEDPAVAAARGGDCGDRLLGMVLPDLRELCPQPRRDPLRRIAGVAAEQVDRVCLHDEHARLTKCRRNVRRQVRQQRL